MNPLNALLPKATAQNPYGMDSGYSLILNRHVIKTLENHDLNPLFVYFRRTFGDNKAQEVFTLFRVGTIWNWDGATVFWQTDIQQIVRTGWIINYHSFTGKAQTVPIMAHVALGIPDSVVHTCLFGEHQLSNRPNATVVIVDNEVAAMIGMVFRPDFVWLASRDMPMIKPDQYKVLEGRKIVLFPRLSGDGSVYAGWNALGNHLRQLLNCHISVSRYLEDNTTPQERADGLGIADFLLRNHTPIYHLSTTPVVELATEEEAPSTVYEEEEAPSTAYHEEEVISTSYYYDEEETPIPMYDQVCLSPGIAIYQIL